MVSSERKEAVSELAQLLGISKNLILLALSMLETKRGYRVWSIPKKPEGERQIQAAVWPLNKIQARISAKIYPYSISEINHGFVAGRWHYTAILPHLWARAFFTFDIKNAFPSTRKQMVVLHLCRIGFRKIVADLMADLICYSPTGKSKDSFLPQGYASSPTVFNLILRDIDRVLSGFAQERDYRVSRYVDNFAISTIKETIPEEERRLAIKIVESLSLGNFKIPDEKTSYSETEERKAHFEFLGLVIEGPKDGERKIKVVDEKLTNYQRAIQKALGKEDFSERKFREIRGKITYLKTIYRGEPLPPRIADLYIHYRLMKKIVNATKRGQLFFHSRTD